MIRRRFRHLALAATLPFALGLTACHKDATDAGTATATAAADSAPLPKVAPPEGKAWSDVVAATPEGGTVMGNPQAPIKLVEYGSLSCPHCAHLSEEMFHKLADDYVNSGRVSYEYRSYAIHSVDVPLTVLVRCAAPETFFGLVEQLYLNQEDLFKRMATNEKQAQAAAALPPEKRFVAIADISGMTDFFAARGVSADQAHACLADPAAAERVAKEAQAISDQGIDSTPTVVINGNRTQAATWAEIEPLLKRAGAR